MCNQILNKAWAVRGISGTEKLVLSRLADRANDQGICYPGQTSLAEDCCLTTRTVRDALTSLVDSGHLKVTVPPSFSTTTTYKVTPKIATQPQEIGSTGEGASGGVRDSADSGKAFRSPPENGSGPLRKELPTNPQVTPIEPTVTPNCADGREEGSDSQGLEKPESVTGHHQGELIDPPPKPPKQPPAPKSRKRDEAFEALIKATGGSVNRLTDAGRGAANKAMADIRRASPDVTNEDISLAVENYRKQLPSSTVTAMAVAKHWDRIAPSPESRLKAEIDNHPSNKHRVGYVADEDTEEQKAELRELCARLKQLKETL